MKDWRWRPRSPIPALAPPTPKETTGARKTAGLKKDAASLYAVMKPEGAFPFNSINPFVSL